jgi:hypothetical protein
VNRLVYHCIFLVVNLMDPTTPDRRQFGLAAIALAGGVLASPHAAAADPEEQPLVVTGQALVESLRVRFGKHLTDAQTAHVKRSVFRGLARAELLRAGPLTNADGPAVNFRADLP